LYRSFNVLSLMRAITLYLDQAKNKPGIIIKIRRTKSHKDGCNGLITTGIKIKVEWDLILTVLILVVS